MTSLEIAGFVRFRIAQVFRWTADDTEASYLANDERQAAVERNFIAIGEGIKDLSKLVDLTAPEIAGPWKQAMSFRDFLAHRYHEGISHPDVWRTVKRDLPHLDDALARIEAMLETADGPC